MFNLGMSELILILAIALIVLGPTKLPAVAKTIGRGLGKLRRASDEVRETIQGEMDALERDEAAKTRPQAVEARQASEATLPAGEPSPPGEPSPAGPYDGADPYSVPNAPATSAPIEQSPEKKG